MFKAKSESKTVEAQTMFVFVYNTDETVQETEATATMTEDERLDEEERLDREWEETTTERRATEKDIDNIDDKLTKLKMCYDNWNLAICKKTGSVYYRTCNWCGGDDIFISDNLEEALENRSIIKEQIDELEEVRERLCNRREELILKIYDIQHQFSALFGDDEN